MSEPHRLNHSSQPVTNSGCHLEDWVPKQLCSSGACCRIFLQAAMHQIPEVLHSTPTGRFASAPARQGGNGLLQFEPISAADTLCCKCMTCTTGDPNLSLAVCCILTCENVQFSSSGFSCGGSPLTIFVTT